MNADRKYLPAQARSVGVDGNTRVLRLSDLRAIRKCAKVAAVCFRIRAEIIEFLLVQTRGGRWTFPKGNAEPGLTTAQAAALEAFEEAGVHGRMEELPFTSYSRRKAKEGERSSGIELVVSAHLCEVRSLEAPRESGRNPTWFSAECAKRRLREDRSGPYGAELARVVDQATSRIRGLRSRPPLPQLMGLRLEETAVSVQAVRPPLLLPKARRSTLLKG